MKYELLPEKITHLKSSGNYTWACYRDNSQVLHSYTLKVLEAQLSGKAAFRRIHRKYLINEAYISVETKATVLLKNGIRLPIARRRQS
jgi:DNA-binding LytR/AlgR family response regulator